MRRSLEYINIIKELDENKFSFVIMDEIFSSTNPEEGIAGAYAIVNISKNMNNISIITTHFSYLSKLEKTGKFKNYRIPIERDSSIILFININYNLECLINLLPWNFYKRRDLIRILSMKQKIYVGKLMNKIINLLWKV